MPEQKETGTLQKIVARIEAAENILVALSSNPEVDEIAAAIGLTLFLDRAGKHVTAIYSGAMPNELVFLKPDETFESNTNSLQDFIVSLNKDKADHLRYKIDGDYVRVYITPYRTTIDESDLQFSHGDFNVDLVVALDVAAASDLDGALSEYGRILHNASAINITTGEPGKFGELEWANAGAGSVAEMVAELAEAMKNKAKIDPEVATALLTGIVSATERFSNEKTTAETMTVAAKLMTAGANQQEIVRNIAAPVAKAAQPEAAETLDVKHGEEAEPIPEAAPVAEPEIEKEPEPEPEPEPEQPQLTREQVTLAYPRPTVSEPLMEELRQMADKQKQETEEEAQPKPEKPVIMPEVKMPTIEAQKDYSKMIDEALSEPLPNDLPPMDYSQPAVAQSMPEQPEMEQPPVVVSEPAPMPVAEPVANPLPMPDDGQLPPPPTPPEVDFNAFKIPGA